MKSLKCVLMYQGSAPMTREIEMPDEHRRYLAGRPTFCNGHEEKDQLRMISRAPITLKPSIEPKILNLFTIHNEIGGVIVVVLHKNPSITPYLLFIFCAIGIIRNIVLCMDSRMGLGVTHLYLDVGGWLNWSLALSPVAIAAVGSVPGAANKKRRRKDKKDMMTDDRRPVAV